MTRQVKTLIAAGAAVVVLGVALFFALRLVDNTESEPSSSTPSTVVSLYSRPMAEIATITLQNQAGEVLLKNTNDADATFTIPELQGLPLKESTIRVLASNCANLSALDTVAESPEDLALYGLDKPRATLVVVPTSGEGLTIQIGAAAPGGAGVYVKTNQNENVYLVSSTLATAAMLELLEFVDYNITPVDANFMLSVESLYLGGTARPQPVVGEFREATVYNANAAQEETPKAFKIVEPHERNYDSTEGQEILESAFAMTAQSVAAIHPTEEQLAAYGLSEPYTVLELSYNEGQKLRLIASQPKDGQCYVMKGNLPIVYQVDSTNLRWVEAQYPDFVMSLLLLAYINDVATVEVAAPGESYTFTLNGADDDMTVFCRGQELELKNFKQLYQVFIGIPTDGYVPEAPTFTPEQALLTITFNYDDTTRPSDSLSFFAGPPRQVYMALNGEVEFLTKSVYVEKVLEDCQRALQGEAVTPIF